ncbi:MAG: aspartate-semialdehyde dehydrogenase [Pseudomonadota bacterium]
MGRCDTELMLRGHGLMTAQIYYRMPDYQSLLQSFLWQEYDLAPEFPKLRKFLDFWRRELDGPLHSVVYSHRQLIGPNEWRKVDGEFVVH